MRLAYISLCMSLWTVCAHALEVEEQRLFKGTGQAVLRVLSTADLDVFEPFLLSFQTRWPEVSVDYTVVSSAELYRAVRAGAAFDVAISSAMDLQFQLVNDGYAKTYQSDSTEALPDWAQWRDQIFAFTTEPAVVVLSTDRFAGLPVPKTRQELVTLLRDNANRFQSAVGTYDIRVSGLGYLFATQEARSTDAYWRLAEVMGRLDPQLFCCSGQMIDEVASGRLALAYNVLGSYAADRLARASGGKVEIIRMQDFANVMLRTAIILEQADNEIHAGALIDMLVEIGLRDTAGDWPLPPLQQTIGVGNASFGPIRLGPALMVYLDPLNRRAFRTEWENAMEQD